MSFTFRPATRDRIGLLFGLAGASGSGKTYSALLLAKGLANGHGKIAVIDTEAGRAKHYADKFDFLHGDFEPPFTPERYVEAIKAAEEAGATVIVIDSMSHEWAGEGGCADMQSAEAERMATDRDGKVNAWKIEAMTAPAWKKPKIRHKRMVSRLLQCRSHLIFCLRAEEKVRFVKEKDGSGRERTNIVPLGFMPICEKGFMFEMSGSMTLHPETPGAARYDLQHKLNDELRAVFPNGSAITPESGDRLREWAERGADVRPSPAEQRVVDGVRALIEQIEDAGSAAALNDLADGKGVQKRRDWLKEHKPTLSVSLEAAFAAAVERLSGIGDSPSDDAFAGPDVPAAGDARE
jgi:energy-coupling factor transporter ATP-binding protein EcfA2